MSITLSWWAMPCLVMVVAFIGGLRLFKADLVGFGVTVVFTLGMGVFAALLTLAVWGIAR